MSKHELQYRSDLVPDLLSYDGPLLRVHVTAPLELVDVLRAKNLPPYPVVGGLALIDAGASVSAIDVSVFEELDIPIVDTMPTRTPHGLADMNLYNASASLFDLPLTRLPLNKIPGGYFRTSTESGSDVIMLLGRDILRLMKFTYDGPNSSLTIEI